VLRKGEIQYQETFDRVQPKIFEQLTKPKAYIYAGGLVSPWLPIMRAALCAVAQ
jgi:hypothetical protein